ncbi:MAG: carboxymuconolactone decarboxylase family protein [Deltaproteobacteria bacterium]|nr:carboxymuconolactone decarboxylase family protein [Deltaproteobacteria bacterium]
MSSERPVFPKPTFTAVELASAVSELLPRLPRLLLATAGPRRVDPRLREIVLLAVSEANRCRYCRAAHGELARGAGVAEDELAALRRRRWQELPPRERAAVVSALRRAGFGVPDATAEDAALERHFLPEEVAALAALVDAIRIANLSGNTVDMLLDRLRGRHRPRRDSTMASELAVAGLWVLGAVPAAVGVGAAGLLRRLRGGDS